MTYLRTAFSWRGKGVAKGILIFYFKRDTIIWEKRITWKREKYVIPGCKYLFKNMHSRNIFPAPIPYIQIINASILLTTLKISFNSFRIGVKAWFINFWSISRTKRIEYILEWNLDYPSVWILSVPFSLKGSTNHVHKLYAVDYINTVCSLDYPFQFRIF